MGSVHFMLASVYAARTHAIASVFSVQLFLAYTNFYDVHFGINSSIMLSVNIELNVSCYVYIFVTSAERERERVAAMMMGCMATL